MDADQKSIPSIPIHESDQYSSVPKETAATNDDQNLKPTPPPAHPPILCLYEGFWHDPIIVNNIKHLQEHFETQPGDILLCSYPKTGTTWLKCLAFAIATRRQYNEDPNKYPLFTTMPHQIIPYLEHTSGGEDETFKEFPSIGGRLISTHIPYTSLPPSIIRALTDNTCKIIYICRDPKATLMSVWHFMSALDGGDMISLEDMVEHFCEGKTIGGPYWDHVLGYWWKANSSSEQLTRNILFLKYEELKRNTAEHVKRLAEFMGCPFSPEEEEAGEVERIVNMCSFENLSGLEVNKRGTFKNFLGKIQGNNTFFRKGGVEDWKEHLTPEMKERMDLVVEEKFKSNGLTF